MYNQKTRHIAIGIFFSLILVSLTGCGQKSPEKAYSETIKQQESEYVNPYDIARKLDKYSFGEKIITDDVSYTVHEITEFTEFDPMGPKPKEGIQYMALRVTVENKSLEEKIFNTVSWNIVTTDNKTYNAVSMLAKKPTLSSTLKMGVTMESKSAYEGWLTFQVDSGSNIDYIIGSHWWKEKKDMIDANNWILIDIPEQY